ncbi:MAG: DegT/DnrJ/EryC1/StrS family aminotransferase, partial [Deltaproteobacteria bacterium]|nr:DegT/DnrJ/EryC1/StrS family aminotransferase [Deltaproteobacteria bacterium]
HSSGRATVDAFEQEFAEKVGISHAVAVASGTAAMHLSLRVLGMGPGDEVIASTLTFIGGVTPIVFQGAYWAGTHQRKDTPFGSSYRFRPKAAFGNTRTSV